MPSVPRAPCTPSLAPPSAVAVLALAVGLLAACGAREPEPPPPPPPSFAREPLPGERHLSNVRQLTFGGENAEAYWSHDGTRLVFQRTARGGKADQIYVMRPDGSDVRLVSTGKGRTTCAWFLPGDRRILYASTHLAGDEPPPPPDRSHGYAWGLFEYEIFTAALDGSDLRRLTTSPGYDAEAVVSPKGDRIVFTSSRDGDVDLYTMALDGSDVRRLTDAPGYDGGAVWSPDGTRIAWRAQRLTKPDEIDGFRALVAKGVVRPNRLELFTMKADGTDVVQVTRNGKANFAPTFTPDGKRLLFSSNVEDPTHRSFDLYLVALDGTGLEPVTRFSDETHDDFDGFPSFSPDGRRLVWCSNRHNEKPHETNVFIADWKD